MYDVREIEQLDKEVTSSIESVSDTNSALSILANNENVLANEEYSYANKLTIMASTAELLGCDKYEVSAEGIADIIKTIINSLKKFISKIWEKIIKLVKTVYKYIRNDDTELDDMIKNTDNLSTEARSNESAGEQNYKLPEFLVTDSSIQADGLARVRYMSSKFKNVRLSLYTAMVEYMRTAHDELGRSDIINMNFSPFKDFFYGTTVKMYDNDKELSIILATIKTELDSYAQGFKFIVGYDKINMHIVMPLSPETNITKIPCDRKNLRIDTGIFFNNYIHDNLLELKSIKGSTLAEEENIVEISNLLRATKTIISNSMQFHADNKTNLAVLNNYMKEMTAAIPNLIRSLNMCNLVMYSEYKMILKNIYKVEKK